MNRLSLGHAVALGLLHGPAEMLPISSSAHVAVLPWLLRWESGQLDSELQKAFEVALHAGTAAALLIADRDEVLAAMRGRHPRCLSLLGLSLLPAALAGSLFERSIEQRLGTPSTIAIGLVAGAAAMAWADRAPQTRTYDQMGAADALSLGLAQACALIPGVSRGGAALAAARLRRFIRADANRLSRSVGLPVIAGATTLKSLRMIERGLPAGAALPFAVGAAGAFASGLVSARLLRRLDRHGPLLPYAAYRVGLAGIILVRTRTDGGRSGRWRTILT